MKDSPVGWNTGRGKKNSFAQISKVLFRGVDHIEPEWKMMDQFFHDMIAPALELDSLTTSHPISVEVNDPKVQKRPNCDQSWQRILQEIEAIFDTISYKKGASIIHMLEDTVGESALKKGLSDYLKEHAYANAMTKDLWKAISKAWDEEKEGKVDPDQPQFTVKSSLVFAVMILAT